MHIICCKLSSFGVVLEVLLILFGYTAYTVGATPNVSEKGAHVKNKEVENWATSIPAKHFEGTNDPVDEGNLWVVLAAGSWGWANYRHQADVCHAYQVVKNHGVPNERIIVFMKDDIAFNKENPHKGVIMNRPNGTNVYEGVPKDYTGNNLNAMTFINVLMGREMNVGSRKTLKSGPNDRVFIYFADHGGPGMSQFGNNTSHNILFASNLTETIKLMYKGKKYSEMVLYWESCNAGSMFQNLPNNINVYALTAANATQSSWACYCDASIPSKSNPRCYGDCFSVHWLEDADDENLRNETLLIQFWITRHETHVNSMFKEHISEVGQWGSVSKMNQKMVSRFLGDKAGPNLYHQRSDMFRKGDSDYFAFPQNEVSLKLLEIKYKNAENARKRNQAYLQLTSLRNKRQLLTDTIQNIMKYAIYMDDMHAKTMDRKPKYDFFNRIESNIVLNEEQYEKCFFPLVQKFQEKCFSMTCNDYLIYEMKEFLPLCKSGIEIDIITKAIDTQCKNQKRICGIR